MSYLTRGPALFAGIGSKANAFRGRRSNPSMPRSRFEEAEA
jgi:hypothetical protein